MLKTAPSSHAHVLVEGATCPCVEPAGMGQDPFTTVTYMYKRRRLSLILISVVFSTAAFTMPPTLLQNAPSHELHAN
eukprot:11204151-Lingulodinium_polyedra.AAC.1